MSTGAEAGTSEEGERQRDRHRQPPDVSAHHAGAPSAPPDTSGRGPLIGTASTQDSRAEARPVQEGNGRDRFRTIAIRLLATLVALAIGVVLWAAQSLLIPIVFALLLSYALDPLQRFLSHRGLPAPLAAAVVVITVVGTLGVSGYALRSQANAFLASLPEAARQIRTAFEQNSRSGPTPVTQVQRAAQEIERAGATSGSGTPAPPGVTRVQVEDRPFTTTDVIVKSTGGVLMIGGQILIVLVLVFYLLATGDLYKRKLVKIVGSTLSEKRVTVEILADIERHIARYLVARLVVSGIVAAVTAATFWALGMSQAGVWGLGAGILNVIPYVGPAAFAACAALAAFVRFGSLMQPLIIGGAAVAIATVEGFLITPVLMGKAGRMNGLSVFLALTIWGFLWGFWGMLLAIPLTMAIKVVCDHLEELNGLGELLGE